MELTGSRRTIQLQMSSTFQSAAMRTLGRGSSSFLVRWTQAEAVPSSVANRALVRAKR